MVGARREQIGSGAFGSVYSIYSYGTKISVKFVKEKEEMDREVCVKLGNHD